MGFMEIVRMPGVITNGVCFLCLNFSIFGIMYQLPVYLIKQCNYTDEQASFAVTVYSVGAIMGGIILGCLTDLTYSRRAPVLFASALLGAVFQTLLVFSDE